MAYTSTNPYTGSVEKTFSDISPALLEEKLQGADHCFKDDWRNRSFADRAIVLKRAAALMRAGRRTAPQAGGGSIRASTFSTASEMLSPVPRARVRASFTSSSTATRGG